MALLYCGHMASTTILVNTHGAITLVGASLKFRKCCQVNESELFPFNIMSQKESHNVPKSPEGPMKGRLLEIPTACSTQTHTCWGCPYMHTPSNTQPQSPPSVKVNGELGPKGLMMSEENIL